MYRGGAGPAGTFIISGFAGIKARFKDLTYPKPFWAVSTTAPDVLQDTQSVTIRFIFMGR